MAPGVRSTLVDNTEKLKRAAEEKAREKKQAAKSQQEEWEMKKKSIAENVSRRTLLMEQSGIKRSSEALRLEQLMRVHGIIKDVTEHTPSEQSEEERK